MATTPEAISQKLLPSLQVVEGARVAKIAYIPKKYSYIIVGLLI